MDTNKISAMVFSDVRDYINDWIYIPIDDESAKCNYGIRVDEEINGLFYDEIFFPHEDKEEDEILDIGRLARHAAAKQIIEAIISRENYATIFDCNIKGRHRVGLMKEEVKDFLISKGVVKSNIKIRTPDLLFVARDLEGHYNEFGIITWYDDDVKFNQDIGDNWRVVAKVTRDGNFYVNKKKFWDKEVYPWGAPHRILGIGRHPKGSCMVDKMYGSLADFINNIMLDEKSQETGEQAFIGEYLWPSQYVFSIPPQ